MVEAIPYEVETEIDELRRQVAELTARLAKLETAPAQVKPAAAASQPAPAIQKAEPEITEEELLVISAAIAAYLGVRPHIRQIRLISSSAWAQEGRVSIQASHRLHA